MRGGGGGSGRGTERGHEPPHLVAAVQVHFLLLVHAIERSLRGGRRHEAPAAYGCSARLPIPTASLIQSRRHAVHKVQRVARCAADSRAVTSKCGDHAALRLDVCLPFHELSTLVLASVLLLCLLLSLPYSFLGHRIPRRPWLNDEEGESGASRRGEKGVVVDATCIIGATNLLRQKMGCAPANLTHGANVAVCVSKLRWLTMGFVNFNIVRTCRRFQVP